MSKKIIIETDSFKSVTSGIEGSINSISTAASRSKVTGNMPALYKYIGLYERLGTAITAYKEVNHENIKKSNSAIDEIHHVDSQLLK